MEYKDYYKVLGVDRNASEKDIKSAYRKLTKKYHPDLNNGDKEAEIKYRDVNEAYEVLGDPDKRSKYDQFGEQWKYYQKGQTPPGGGGFSGGFDFSDIFSQFSQGNGGGIHFSTSGGSGHSSFFETLFGNMGGMGGSSRRSNGGFSSFSSPFGFSSDGGAGFTPEEEPKMFDLNVSLAEAYSGTSKTVSISQGSQVHNIDVKIPAGARKVKVRANGRELNRDITFKINIESDPVYKIENNYDLRCNLYVPLKVFYTGGSADLKLPNGKSVAIKVDKGAENGKIMRLKGLGLPRSKGEAGNIFVTLLAVLPKLTDEQIKAL